MTTRFERALFLVALASGCQCPGAGPEDRSESAPAQAAPDLSAVPPADPSGIAEELAYQRIERSEVVVVGELIDVPPVAGAATEPVRQQTLTYRALRWIKGQRPDGTFSVEQPLFPGSPAENAGELRDVFKQRGRRYLLVLRDQGGVLRTAIPPIAATDAVIEAAAARANSSN
jgi:hypothetical protein